MTTGGKFYRIVLFFLTLLSALLFVSDDRAHARNSRAWEERLAARTATLWIEGQPLGDGIILNSRGELSVTWLESGLSRFLSDENEVDEWVLNGLNYYFSRSRETRAKLRGRDVFVLNYRAIKNWSFDPAKLMINGYAVTPDDILTGRGYWESELTPGDTGTVEVAAPSLRPGQTVELRYEDTEAELEIPRTRAR